MREFDKEMRKFKAGAKNRADSLANFFDTFELPGATLEEY
jgi:hypothetical protein